MKKIITSSISIILLLPACASTSSAIQETVDAKPKQDTFFEHFDTNKDQQVTADEFIAARSDRFKKDDQDGNDFLSRKEYIQASKQRKKSRKEKKRSERRTERFNEMDVDQNSTIDEEEFLASSQARALKSFANMDTDKSGIISSEEYNTFRYPGHHNPMKRKYSPYQMFKNTDTNEDNQISMEEQKTARMKWFNNMDINGDNVVTPDEAKQARNKRKIKK